MWLNKVKGIVAGFVTLLVVAGVGVGVGRHAPAQPPLAGGNPDERPTTQDKRDAARSEKAPPTRAEPKPPLDPPPPRPDDMGEAVLAEWPRHADALETVVLQFEQAQNKRAYWGTVKYLHPDRFLIESHDNNTDAVVERLIVDGETSLEMLPQQKRAYRTRLPKGEYSLPMLLLGLKPDALRRRFDLRVVKEDSWYVYVTITPRAADRERISQARLVLNKETWLVRQLWVLQPDGTEVGWDILKADTKTPLKAEDFTASVPAGWAITDKPFADPRAPADGAPETAGKGDVLDGLVGELLEAQRGHGQAVEAIYLAVLARLPSESERKIVAEHLGRQKDRRQALRELVRQLTETEEFRRKLESLSERLKRGPAR